ncbi:hypothetical protein FKP32DRAFT_1679313, partial [Trametes sanguinea]
VARAAPSGSPGTAQNGVIALYTAGTSPTSGATPLAWMGQYQITTFEALAFSYTYTQPSPSDALVELNCASDPGYRFGAMPNGPRTSAQLGPGNNVYVKYTQTGVSTPAGATAGAFNSGKYSVGYVETTIFSIDDATGLITTKWVNPDGTVPPSLYHIIYASSLYLTGDVNQFLAQTGATMDIIKIVVRIFSSPFFFFCSSGCARVLTRAIQDMYYVEPEPTSITGTVVY